MKRKIAFLSLVSLLVLALSLAGCGKQTSSTTTTTTTSGNTTTTTSKPATVNFAIIAPASGGFGTSGTHMVEAFKMAISEINAAGGIWGGTKINPMIYDSKSDVAQAQAAATKAVMDDNCIIVGGSYEAGSERVVQAFLKSKNIPYVNAAAMDNDSIKNGYPGFVTVAPQQMTAVNAQMRYFAAQGKKSFIYVAPQVDYCTINDAAMQKWGTDNATTGLKVMPTIYFDVSSADITAQVTKAISQNPDVLEVGAFSGTWAAQVAATVTNLGYKGQVVEDLNALNKFETDAVAAAGYIADGWIAEYYFPLYDDPSNTANYKFGQAWVAAYPNEGLGNLDDAAICGYQVGYVMALAMNIAGPGATAQQIDDAYRKINWVSPLGYNLTFNSDGQAQFKEMFMYRFDKSKNTVVKIATLPVLDTDITFPLRGTK